MSLIESESEKDTGFQEVPIMCSTNHGCSVITQTISNAIYYSDLKHIESKDEFRRANLVQAIKDACMRVGFFYVKNHGIPDETINETLEMCKKFFELPTEMKMAIENKKTPNFKGYSPLLSGNNDPCGVGDMQEGFEFGWEAINGENETKSEDGVMAGANIWPSEGDLPGFRDAVLCYYHAAVKLGKSLFPLFAIALDLPQSFFDDKVLSSTVICFTRSQLFQTKYSAALMKLLLYPPQAGPSDERIIGIGAHTDWECFTILWQEPGIQALQVLNTNKQWINAPPIPGTLIINLGDQFARWTNDIFKSNIHRVINRSGIPRYSIPLFFGTDYNVRLDPIPGCVSSERPLKYTIMSAGEYVKARLQATYSRQ